MDHLCGMKAINILASKPQILIDPSKLKILLTRKIKTEKKEITVIRLLQIIFLACAVVGLFVFMGIKLL